MLIVVTGNDGIGKRQIARDITLSLAPELIVNGIEVKYTHDIDGNVHYNLLKDGVDINTSEKDEHGMPVGIYSSTSIEDYMSALEAAEDNYAIISHGVKIQHIWDSHIDPDYDYNIVANHKAIDAPNTMLHPTDVVEMYNNKTSDHLVVSGLFSKYYIDHIIGEVGSTNVKVINIIRHPSVSYLLDYKSPEFYDSPTKPDLTPAENKQKFMESILVPATLQTVSYVETIKFEDILANGITVLDTCITQGEGYSGYNDLISIYEHINHEPQDLTEFNEQMAEYDPLFWDPQLEVSDNPDYNTQEEYIKAVKDNIQTNLFDLYPDYIALDYDTILSKP